MGIQRGLSWRITTYIMNHAKILEGPVAAVAREAAAWAARVIAKAAAGARASLGPAAARHPLWVPSGPRYCWFALYRSYRLANPVELG